MNILVTNDDSISAKGIRILAECASQFGAVTVVAPESPCSGQSSAITINRALHLKSVDYEPGIRAYAVDGTPVDCVKLALHTLFPDKPDLILSGINHGSNAGNAIVYSGTLGAVLEGCMAGIRSVGFSLLDYSPDADFSKSEKFVAEIIEKVINYSLPEGVALNVNIPAHIVPAGIRVCRAARGFWTEEYERYSDICGNPYYMLAGRFVNEDEGALDTDEHFLSEGYVSVVPVTTDMTAHHALSLLHSEFNR